MKTGHRPGAWLGLWLVALLLLYLGVAQSLRVSSDLRLFLPEAVTAEQGLILDGIGEGPASRMLLVALTGADAPSLAMTSQRMVEELRGNRAFLRVDNGSVDAVPGFVTEYRYLLSPAWDRWPLDAATLREALTDRLQDLASPAAPVLEPLIPADPTLEVLEIAESWSARRAPQQIGGAWFDAAGKRALLAVQTRAAGFDSDGQQRALRNSMRHPVGPHRRDRPDVDHRTGSVLGVEKERTQHEATWLGTVAIGGLLVLLFVAYRRPRVPVLAALPLASAALAGLRARSRL